MPSKNRYLEAFKESHNAIGIAAVVALCAATLNPIPLVAGLVLEAAYLLIVPDSKWYAARLAKKYDGEIEERRRKLKEQTLPTLRPELQQRFARLETLRQQIGDRAAEDERWFELRASADAALVAAAGRALPDASVEPIGTSARVGGTTGCEVEAMEGYAVLRAAALAGVPALEVRVLANAIGEPDRARWRFAEAKAALAEALPAIVEELARA